MEDSKNLIKLCKFYFLYLLFGFTTVYMVNSINFHTNVNISTRGQIDYVGDITYFRLTD